MNANPCLPWEIIKEIVGYYTGSNLRLRAVCKRMYSFAIKQYCDAHTIHANANTQKELIQHAKTLHIDDPIDLRLANPITLRINDRFHMHGPLTHMTRLRSLATLSINTDELLKLTTLTHLELWAERSLCDFRTLTNLTSLSVSADAIIDGLPLVKLSLLCCNDVNVPSAVRDLKVYDSKFPRLSGPLQSLVLGYGIEMGHDCIQYTRALETFVSEYCIIPSDFLDDDIGKHLRTLEIEYPETDDIHAMINIIATFTSLTRLSIRTDIEVSENFLSNLTALVDLQFDIDEDILIEHLTSLKRLCICSGKITDEFLRKNTSLVYLYVEPFGVDEHTSPITNYGLEPLTCLEYLDLRSNDHVTDAGIMHLINLKHVYIDFSMLTTACGDLIREQRYLQTGDRGQVQVHDDDSIGDFNLYSRW